MNSIRTRLLVSLLALLALGALLAGLASYRSVLRETEALFDYQLRQMALSLRDQGEIDDVQANALRDEALEVVVQIWTVEGRSIYASRPPDRQVPARVVLGFADVSAGGRVWRSYGVAARDRVIQVAQPLQIRQRLAADAALRSVTPLLALAPLLAGAVWWLVGWAFGPLARVAREVRSRDAGSLVALGPLAPRLGEAGGRLPREIAPLVEALDALLARLGASFDAQRAFVADAAHELRSPLTALKLQLRAMGRAGDAAERDAAQAALEGGVERATRLVEQLLTLARSEPGAADRPFTTLDLAELARQALADTVPYAASRGTQVELDVSGRVMLQGDPQGLAALARNLADNAVRYAPPGSTVRVRVDRDEAGAARLQVDDAGPGIPVEARERVFDRFRRHVAPDDDGSAQSQGSGLGLAIVRQVAQRHGARVSLGDSPAGGLRVTVCFPDATVVDAGTMTGGPGAGSARGTMVDPPHGDPSTAEP